MDCPKCSHTSPEPFDECPRCGIVVAKLLADQRGLYRARPHRTQRRDRDVEGAKRALLIGAPVALAIYLVPLTRYMLSYLAVVVHELGHAATALAFGYPSLPSLDFVYGGGVTWILGRSATLLLLVGAGWVALWWRLRQRPRAAMVIAALSALWLVGVITPLDNLLIGAMGHGAELLFAGVFFFRALDGRVARNPTERWLYATCSLFLSLSAWVFAFQLMNSALFQRQYGQAKGGGHWMDMSRLAESLGTDLVVIAGLFWLATIAPPTLAYLVWFNREALERRLQRLTTPG